MPCRNEEELIKQPNHERSSLHPLKVLVPEETISDLMQKRGIYASPDEILVLSGSQQGIDIAFLVLSIRGCGDC